MSGLSIEQLRSAFKTQDTNESRPNNYYPFWNMKVGEQATIRFLPDANPENPLGFMVEKLMHSLTINGETKTIPCLKMYGEDDCPICKVSSAYYKADDKVNGKKYWRKKQHLVQALVIDDPLPDDSETGESHEGKVRVIALGFQLFNIIKEAFESGELDEIPYAYEDGCNFIIKKTKQGEYDTYAVGSKFARRSSSLDEDEIAFVEEELLDLATLLPAHPTYEKVESMLEADITGNSYTENDKNEEDEDEDEKASSAPAKTSKPSRKLAKKAVVENEDDDDEEDEEEDEPAPKKKPASKKAPAKKKAKVEDDDTDGEDEDFSDEATDILDKIRNRRKDS